MTDAPPLPAELGTPVAAEPIGGGSIAETWRVDLADGRRVVVKRTGYDARLEADGLEALADVGAPVPAVLAVTEDVLVLEHVGGAPDWAGLGRTLAQVHRTGRGDAFGWDRDNVIGSLPQANPRTGSWPAFYVEHRLRAHLDAPALPRDVRLRLERACDGPAQELLEHGPVPSLVHGDLWSGNVVDGRWLIDPAVYHADREVELAFAEVFGGFPPVFWRGYEEVWPLDDGWERRRPALQLHHLLVHVRLFGAGYVGAVVSRLDRLGW